MAEAGACRYIRTHFYTFYRMNWNVGEYNTDLTRAVKRVAANSNCVVFSSHAEEAMDDDQFDHADVLLCLRRGNARGPEIHGAEVRANVFHAGLHIRVAIQCLDSDGSDWSSLRGVRVITVMRI